MGTLQPEFELLCLCARTSIPRPGRIRLRDLLRESIDWELLLQLASLHRVTPLVCRSLGTHAATLVPSAVMARLQHHDRMNVQHSLRMTSALLSLLKLLDAHRIRAIPYKGPILAATLYGDLGLREFTDLDILIDKSDAPRARDLLAANGYKLYYQWDGTPHSRHPRTVLKHHWEYAFTRKDDVHVELHCPLHHECCSFPFDFETLWARSEQLCIANAIVCSLCPEDLFLILCAHAAKHFWARLQWLCDISELIRMHQDLNWKQMAHQLHQTNSPPMFLAALHTAHDLLGSPLPDHLLERWKAALLPRFFAAIIKGQLLRAGGDLGFAEPERILFTLWTLNPLRQQILYGFRAVRWAMRPRGTAKGTTVPLPGSASFLLDLLGWSWLLLEGCRILWKDFGALAPLTVTGE